MKYLLIRHAKTDANRITRAAFGKFGAPLNGLGKKQAQDLAIELEKSGIDISSAAVSELTRTQQTAELAGFKHLTIDPLLNEIETGNPKATLELVAQGKLPKQAILAAKAILLNPPKEKIWVTHGLVIAALLVELGLSNPERFVPGHCEIREIAL